MKTMFITLPHHFEEGQNKTQVFKTPPITYLWLGSLLEQDGHHVEILDALSLGLNLQQILKNINEIKPDIIGFSIFTNGYHDMLYIARHIKEKFPGIKVAVGGYHANSIPSDFYNKNIDYVFVGEAEFDFVELVNRLRNGDENKDGICNLHYPNPETGGWVSNPMRELRTFMDDQPLLPYDKILANGYTSWWTVVNPKRHKYMATITGRGCAFNCSFCDISKTEGLRYRCMSPGRVIEEIEHMVRLGITHIEFRDPFFTADMARMIEIAELLLKKNIKIEWGCSSTISKIRNQDVLNLLYRAGVRFLFFGVESGNPEILKREKKVTPQKVKEAVRMTKKAGIQAHCSFIFGLEGENEASLKETLDFSLALNPTSASYSIASPYPGTTMFESYKEKNYLTTYDWRKYNSIDPVFETPEISKDLLKKYLKKSHLDFYFRPKYIWSRFQGINSIREFVAYSSIALSLLVDTTAYKS